VTQPTLTSLAKAGGCAAKYSAARLEELLSEGHDLDALGARECRNERLDQLAIDLVLGLR